MPENLKLKNNIIIYVDGERTSTLEWNYLDFSVCKNYEDVYEIATLVLAHKKRKYYYHHNEKIIEIKNKTNLENELKNVIDSKKQYKLKIWGTADFGIKLTCYVTNEKLIKKEFEEYEIDEIKSEIKKLQSGREIIYYYSH